MKLKVELSLLLTVVLSTFSTVMHAQQPGQMSYRGQERSRFSSRDASQGYRPVASNAPSTVGLPPSPYSQQGAVLPATSPTGFSPVSKPPIGPRHAQRSALYSPAGLPASPYGPRSSTPRHQSRLASRPEAATPTGLPTSPYGPRSYSSPVGSRGAARPVETLPNGLPQSPYTSREEERRRAANRPDVAMLPASPYAPPVASASQDPMQQHLAPVMPARYITSTHPAYSSRNLARSASASISDGGAPQGKAENPISSWMRKISPF